MYLIDSSLSQFIEESMTESEIHTYDEIAVTYFVSMLKDTIQTGE